MVPGILGRKRGMTTVFTPEGTAVAVNEAVVPRSTWGATALQPGDRVEVLIASQGG